MYILIGMNVKWKYLSRKSLEMIGLCEICCNCVKICAKIFNRKGNNLELKRDEIYEMDII